MIRIAFFASVVSAAKPVIELSLSAPSHPHPAIADAIASSEKSAGYSSDLSELDRAYS